MFYKTTQVTIPWCSSSSFYSVLWLAQRSTLSSTKSCSRQFSSSVSVPRYLHMLVGSSCISVLFASLGLFSPDFRLQAAMFNIVSNPRQPASQLQCIKLCISPIVFFFFFCSQAPIVFKNVFILLNSCIFLTAPSIMCSFYLFSFQPTFQPTYSHHEQLFVAFSSCA